VLGAVLLMLSENSLAGDVRDIELRRLFEPTEAEREEESTGRIYIYDGLRDFDVERAMRDEYDRIENMMFIREKKTDGKGEVLKNPATGEDVVEDDGC
jgi:predicted transcriptional regulator